MIDQKQTKITDWLIRYTFNPASFLFMALLIILLTGLIAITICFPSIGPDSGFYLKIACDMNRGYSFFKDMNVAYTPMGMYILSFVFKVFPGAGLSFFYSLIVFLYFISALLFHQILEYFQINRTHKRLFTLLLLLTFFLQDGSNILLEPFVLIFQLPAILLLLKWDNKPNLILLPAIGLLCFMAFYSKQYGISVLLAVCWLIYNHESSLKQFFLQISGILVGILIPASLVIIYFNQLGVPIHEMIKRLMGIDYLSGNEIVTGTRYNFLKFLESVGRFLTDIPVMFMLLVFAFQKRKNPLSKQAIFLVLLISGACVQLYFAGYRHYYQLIAPFCLILIAYLMQQTSINSVKLQCFYSFFWAATFVIALIFTIKIFTDKREGYLFETQNTARLTHVVPSGQKVYLEGISPAYYYLCGYNSPDFKKLGYRFPDEMNKEYICRSIPSGAYLIASPDYLKEEELVQEFQETAQIQLSNGTKCVIFQKK